jgi:hypothetical protein
MHTEVSKVPHEQHFVTYEDMATRTVEEVQASPNTSKYILTAMPFRFPTPQPHIQSSSWYSAQAERT